jgi:hypothetical protein
MKTVQRTAHFDRWLRRLRDDKAKQKIAARLDRLEAGNPGDHRHLGGRLSEMRIDYGPGWFDAKATPQGKSESAVVPNVRCLVGRHKPLQRNSVRQGFLPDRLECLGRGLSPAVRAVIAFGEAHQAIAMFQFTHGGNPLRTTGVS